MRVSRYFKYSSSSTDNIPFLGLGFRVEVHLSYLQDDALQDDAIYEMIVHSVNKTQRTLQVFFEDDGQQKLYTVPFKGIAPLRSPLRSAVFSPGSNVEVRYRIDVDSPWGWWPAKIQKTVYDENMETPHGGPTGYIVTFPPTHSPELVEQVPYYFVRSESFCV